MSQATRKIACKTRQSMRCHLHHSFISQSLRIDLCDLIWQIHHSCNCLDDGHCDVTDQRKMSVLGTAGAKVTTHGNSVMM